MILQTLTTSMDAFMSKKLSNFRLKKERKIENRSKREASDNNKFIGGTAYNDGPKPKREDRSHLKCTYPGCGKTGYTEENC